jgi:selenocysteine lyase/cysteine desulfurase
MKTNYSHPEGMTYISPEILSDTAQCLTTGGDARIALDTISGINQYGCRPYPDPTMLAYGSSTASIISTQGYYHAGQLHQRLITALKTASATNIYSYEIKRIREELIHLCELPVTTGMIFSASGTDIHSLVACYAGRENKLAPRIIMIEANETGKGVNAALKSANHHEQSEVIPVKVRLEDGELRPITAIDEEVDALVTEAIAKNRRVLLIVTDQSKTGLIAPSLSCVLDLQQRFQDKLDVLIDACQFRVAPPTLCAYLELGFMVALTGSKFLTGPSFSGVILFKCSLSNELEAASRVLRASSQTVNFGLLLRWEVALQELKAFRSISQEYIGNFIGDFAAAIHERLQQDAFFEPLPVPIIDRSSLLVDSSWDQLQTIFPFLLYHADTQRTPLSAEETMAVYQQLPLSINDKHVHQASTASVRCQTGQPVACGQRNGVAISALRLCISTRLIVESASAENKRQSVIDEALLVLDKITLLVRLLPVNNVL